jgi:sigma-B regulation protein RsbU (phosphoserine phosphatase)
MSTTTSRLQETFPFISDIKAEQSAARQTICDLLRLQKAAQQITSILDLDQLLESFVENAVEDFGAVEASVLLKDPARDELILAAMRGCSVHEKGQRFRVGKDGLVGMVALLGHSYYAPDVRKEPNYIRCEPEALSELNVPLKAGGRLIGIFNISHPELDGFTQERIELLEALAGHLTVAIENARIFREERAENLLLRTEQEEAARIQRELLPRMSPLVSGLRAEAYLVPARAVGGDWYDYIPLPDGRWAFVLADVAGKAMAAAILMASVRGMLRSLVRRGSSPAEILTELNGTLIEDLPPERFVTLMLGIYDPTNRLITVANAGHPPPVLVKEGKPRFLKTCSGFPLGIMENEYHEAIVDVTPESRLLFYTDGITEAESPIGEEFGSKRVLEAAVRPELRAEELVNEVIRFCGNGHCQDDATVMVLRGRE